MNLDQHDLSDQAIKVHDVVVQSVTYDRNDPTTTRIQAQGAAGTVEFVLRQQPHSQLPEIMQVQDGHETAPDPELAQSMQEWVRYDLAAIAAPPAAAMDLSPMPMTDWDMQMDRPSLAGVLDEAPQVSHTPDIDTGGLGH